MSNFDTPQAQKNYIKSLERERDALKLALEKAAHILGCKPEKVVATAWSIVDALGDLEDEHRRTLDNQAAAFEAQRAAALAENAELRRAVNDLTGALSDAMRAVPESDAALIGELMRLFEAGAGEDCLEYQRALEIIGAPPVGDVSGPGEKE
jgi:hypothetical protein